MGKKKETQGLLDQKTRLIGIAAAGHSVGCTHFSIMLLNYLAGYRRRRAALMEWNSTGDLERLEKVCTGMVRESSAYRVLEADYFKHPFQTDSVFSGRFFCYRGMRNIF